MVTNVFRVRGRSDSWLWSLGRTWRGGSRAAERYARDVGVTVALSGGDRSRSILHFHVSCCENTAINKVKICTRVSGASSKPRSTPPPQQPSRVFQCKLVFHQSFSPKEIFSFKSSFLILYKHHCLSYVVLLFLYIGSLEIIQLKTYYCCIHFCI